MDTEEKVRAADRCGYVKARPPRRFNKLYDALAQALMDFGANDMISVGVSLSVRKGMPLKVHVSPLRDAQPLRTPAKRKAGRTK